MAPGLRTASSAGRRDNLRNRLKEWLFLEGSRLVIAIGIIVVFVGALGTLVSIDVIAVGADSSVASVFASGIISGVVTLVTIAASINQLVLSRVFGSPGKLRDRLEGSRDLRERVERLAGQPSSPNDPAAFLSLLATTLSERATAALSTVEQNAVDSPAAVTDVLTDIGEYGRSINTQIEDGTPIIDILGVIVGPEYATNITAVQHLRNEYGESFSANTRAELEAVDELLESVAVVRQFYKTLALQQDLAILSRHLIYSGLTALLVSISMALVYRTDTVMLSPSALVVLVPVAVGVVVAPLALFGAYVIRAATVAYQTLSVGPFVPPGER